MRLIALTAILLALANASMAAELNAQQREQVRKNVQLYDELMACSKKPEFSQYGLAVAGPCGDWAKRVANEKKNDLLIIRAGLNCMAGDIEMAGMSALNPSDRSNREHLAWVKANVEECRSALES